MHTHIAFSLTALNGPLLVTCISGTGNNGKPQIALVVRDGSGKHIGTYAVEGTTIAFDNAVVAGQGILING